MALQWPRISRAAAEKGFVTVRNANTSKLSVGHLAHWYYYASAATASGDGYSVTHAPTTATSQISPLLAAGCVANNSILYSQYGELQVYGEHSAVVVTGVNGAPPFTDVFTISTVTQGVWDTLVLKPVNAFGNTTGAATNIGALAPIQMSTTIAGAQTYTSTSINQQLCAYWPGGFAVPLANPAATIATNASGTLKAFLYFL